VNGTVNDKTGGIAGLAIARSSGPVYSSVPRRIREAREAHSRFLNPCFVPIRRPGTAKKKDRRSGCQPPPAVMSRQLKNTRSVLKSPWCSDY